MNVRQVDRQPVEEALAQWQQSAALEQADIGLGIQPDHYGYKKVKARVLMINNEMADALRPTDFCDEGNNGTVSVTLDFDAAGDPGEDFDDDPVGVIEFGQYKLLDRIISWQEIYNRPTH